MKLIIKKNGEVIFSEGGLTPSKEVLGRPYWMLEEFFGEKNPLGLEPGWKVKDFGITEIFETEYGYEMVPLNSGSVVQIHNRRMAEWSSRGYSAQNIENRIAEKTYKNVIVSDIDGVEKELDYSLEISMLQEGYILNIGKINYCNQFGGELKPYYLKKLTSRNYSASTRENARVFDDATKLKNFLNKNKFVLSELRRSGNYFSIEPTTPVFAEDVKDSKLKKYNLGACYELLKEIHVEVEIKEDSIATLEEIEKEIRNRKYRLSICSDGIHFRNKTANEAPMDIAIEAMKNTLDFKVYPYAVIREEFEFGLVDTVLYVSECFSEWDYERMDKECWVAAYVYNHTNDMCSEFGSVRLLAVNGILKRVG